MSKATDIIQGLVKDGPIPGLTGVIVITVGEDHGVAIGTAGGNDPVFLVVKAAVDARLTELMGTPGTVVAVGTSGAAD